MASDHERSAHDSEFTGSWEVLDSVDVDNKGRRGWTAMSVSESTIIHISDLHIDGLTPGVEMSAHDWEVLARTLKMLSPDLVVVTGDLSTRGSCNPAALQSARDFLDNLGVEYMVLPGNHDLSPRPEHRTNECFEDVSWEQTHFGRVFRQPPTVVRHVGLVTVIGLALRDDDQDGALTALQAALDKVTGPTLVFGHYPLQTIREHGVLSRFGWSDYVPRAMPVLRRILLASPQVRIYGCGHVHAASVLALTPTLRQISAGGLGPGPSQFWLYKIRADQLGYFSVMGSGPGTFWDPGDTGGEDAVSYHWGDVRLGLIDLTGSGAPS